MIPKHTRFNKFGTVVHESDGTCIELTIKDILISYVAELDERGLVLENANERAYFIMEQYVSKILDIPIKDPFDVMRSNDVEDLTESTMWYKYMQLFTTYPIWDLYKMDFQRWMDQPYKDIEFQLKMARLYKQSNTTTELEKQLLENSQKVMIDEHNSVNIEELRRQEIQQPVFKKTFG